MLFYNRIIFRFGKEILNIHTEVPAIIKKNMNNDLAFRKEFDLNNQLIILRAKAENIESKREIQYSFFGAILLSFGIYGIYEAYFSKSDSQIKKMKLSAKCYYRSFYKQDYGHIIEYIDEMKQQNLKNTGFMVYLLSIISHADINTKLAVFSRVGEIVASNDVYLNYYGKVYAQQCKILIDQCIRKQINTSQILIPAMITYLYSTDILNEIQGLYYIGNMEITNSLLKTKIQEKVRSQINDFEENEELFTLLQNSGQLTDYREFKEIYQKSLECQRQRLLRKVLV